MCPRWWRRLRGGVWQFCEGVYDGRRIRMWVRNASPPSTVKILKVEVW